MLCIRPIALAWNCKAECWNCVAIANNGGIETSSRDAFVRVSPLSLTCEAKMCIGQKWGGRRKKKLNGKKKEENNHTKNRRRIHRKPSWQFHSVGSASLYVRYIRSSKVSAKIVRLPDSEIHLAHSLRTPFAVLFYCQTSTNEGKKAAHKNHLT